MDLNEVKIRERKYFEDLVTYLDLFNLEDMDSVEEYAEGIQHISEIGGKYRHVHVELKCLMGNEYEAEYDKYKAHSLQISKYLKDAKARMKEAGRLAKEAESMSAQGKAREAVTVEVNVFQEKLEAGSTEVESITDGQAYCTRYESFLDEYYCLLGKARIAFGNDFESHQCKTTLNYILETINSVLADCKLQVAGLREKETLAEAAKIELEHTRSEQKYVKQQGRIAEMLKKEINFRCDSLIKSCDIKGLDDLDGYQIFEQNKHLYSTLECSLREIMVKFSEFEKVVSSSDTLEKLLEPLRLKREKALSTRNGYAQKIFQLMKTRNITEETLRRSQETTIDLPKFQGYDSNFDIYSFRHQFEKLVQPGTQKKFWVDSLKTKYLEGPAYTLVEKIDDIDEVWKKLTESYGNVKLLLHKKLGELDKFDNLGKIKGDEKIAHTLSKVINMMTELSTLAEKYNLENKLYVGGGLEKIYSLIGENRERNFLRQNLESEDSSSSPSSSDLTTPSLSTGIVPEKLEWNKLKIFLEKEQKLREKYILLEKSKESLGVRPRDNRQNNSTSVSSDVTHVSMDHVLCHLCGKSDHVVSTDLAGVKHIDYVSCEEWVKKSAKQKRLQLVGKKLCFSCLSPGKKFNEDHHCSQKYVCPHDSHNGHEKGLHVLVCGAHRDEETNISLLDKYKRNFIFKRSGNFKNFTRELTLTYFSDSAAPNLNRATGSEEMYRNARPDVQDSAIFMFQTIDVDGHELNLFFDNGGGKIIVKKSALEILKKLGRANCPRPGPASMFGVGGVETACEDGIFDISLPLRDGTNGLFSGVCMDTVTMDFPVYPLREVERDIHSECRREGGEDLVNQLPKLSNEVGGHTDILIGIKYFMYHPELIWKSSSGLSIFSSCFLSADGTTGVVGGPHSKFTEAERRSFRSLRGIEDNTHTQRAPMMSAYLSHPATIYRESYKVHNAPLMVCDAEIDSQCQNLETQIYLNYAINEPAHVAKRPPRNLKVFEEIDNSGTEVLFRCEGCRNCERCKTSRKIEDISIIEEAEQHLIEQCVTVDIEKCKTSHLLPFVVDPDTRIDEKAQTRLAIKVYDSVIKSLEKSPSDREAVIKSEKKLHDLGYVDYVDNMPVETQKMINDNLKYILPWRLNYNGNSVTTPVRIVIDGRACPKGSVSINSTLAKGTNNMNNLAIMMIRFQCYPYVFHTDISKMYNTVLLDERHWRYQLYYWQEELKVGVPPKLKAIKTAMYGMKPSGNVAECAMRKTAELTKEMYPKAYRVIMDDMYVDDCLSGCATMEERSDVTNQLPCFLDKGGFGLKGIW